MSFSLDIFVEKNELKRLGIEETKFEWGGELYSQEPKQYFNNSGLDFQEFLDVEYYKKYHSSVLENDLNLDDYLAIRLMGSDALDLEVLVNTDVESIKELELMKFLSKIVELESFAIFVLRDEEYVDKRIRVSSQMELLKVVSENLSWNSPQGMLITR